MYRALFLVLLQACQGSISTQKQYGTSTIDETQRCDVQITSSYPYPDDVNMYYRAAVEIEFSQALSQASLHLLDEEGQVVAGETHMVGNVLSFQPTESLLPIHNYTAQIDYCGATEPVDLPFRTSALGTPFDNGIEDIVFKTYALDLAKGHIVEPSTVGDALRTLLQNTFLVEVLSVEDGLLQVHTALSKSDSLAQNYCVPTIEDFPLADFSQSPYFEIDPKNVSLHIGGYDVVIYHFSISGVFTADGSTFTKAVGQGVFDGRELYPIMNDFGFALSSPDEFCTLLERVGVACQSCPSDGAQYCIPLSIEDMEAYEITGGVDPVCEGHCHELCSESSCADIPEEYGTCL